MASSKTIERPKIEQLINRAFRDTLDIGTTRTPFKFQYK